MSSAKSPAKKPRQVTVQPQEPKPERGGPPARADEEAKPPRRVAPGAQDKRSGNNRDGLA